MNDGFHRDERDRRDKNNMLHSELTGKILEACFEVSNELGVGYVESVYEKALLVALNQKGIRAQAQGQGFEEQMLNLALPFDRRTNAELPTPSLLLPIPC